MEQKIETAVFGGGCFWCTEAVFEQLRGVISVMPGYAGGEMPNPTYEQVSSGMSGYAEVTQIVFDPGKISYDDLLTVFFATHDPTSLNRQGSDVGTQYRSVIFYTTPEQKQHAEIFIKNLDTDSGGKPIVTDITPLVKFYEAEEYHQKYYQNNSSQPYCQIVISPKLAKLQEKFYQLLKKPKS